MDKRKRLVRRVGLVLALALLTVGLSAAVMKKIDTDYTPLDKEFYLSQEQVAFVRPGLEIEVVDYNVAADGTVTARVEITDDAGMPLDINGVMTPGPIRLSFILAYIPQGGEWYVNYNQRSATGDFGTVMQATSDSGTLTEVETGVYDYLFGAKVDDMDASHTIGFYAERNLDEWELGAPMADGTVIFVPSGADVVDVREIVTDDACAKCHDPLRIHGRRHSYQLCITCHYEGVLDPDTGNTVDMREMIHKIHMGEELENGYTIIGFQGSVHDYSEVVFPQDHRNCTTCHAAEASQWQKALTNPTRASCGSCHDGVNFASGEGHLGGPQISDRFCANCHFVEGELEFDASVIGAHTIPSKSNQLAGINVEILDVTTMGPGTPINVNFTLTNDDGTPIDVADMNRLRMLVAGPTSDYVAQWTEDVKAGAVPAGVGSARQGAGEYMFSSAAPLPDDAEGSWVVGFEGRRPRTLNPGMVNAIDHNEQIMDNPVMYFAVTDEEVVPRRPIVDDAKCEECHENLELHGSNRHNATDYCQFCHHPLSSDAPERTPDQMPARSVNFSIMIHRIHAGEHLSRDYTVIGHNGSVNNFNHVIYPGDLRNCAKCHVDDSYVESGGVANTVTLRELFSPMPPNTVACVGCHDSEGTQAHAFLNIAPFGEACMACHGPNRDFSVARSHAR